MKQLLLSIIILTFALAAMALAFGAVYPKFNAENAAEIPTSFGGLLFMMSATALIGIVIAFEAWPVYNALTTLTRNRPLETDQFISLAIGLGSAFALAATVIAVSLRVAVRRIEAIEP